MATVRQALITAAGDESAVTVVTADLAEPPAGHVQVSVDCAGFSGADVNMRRGTYPSQRKAPLVPGYCLAGRVVANGPGCGRFRPGDRVACLTVYGAEADRANLPERYLVPVPPEVSSAVAAALTLDWNTAYRLVNRTARMAAGQAVFVHGLSGAVGHALMVLSQLNGAQVSGTASPPNHPALAAAGATPFDYADKAWIAAVNAGGGVDAAFDPLGFDSFDESYAILRRGGLLVGYGMNGPALAGTPGRPVVREMLRLMAKNLARPVHGKRATFAWISRDQKTFAPDLLALFDLVRTNRVTVPIKAEFPLTDVAEAHRAWGKGGGIGSVVIRVAGG